MCFSLRNLHAAIDIIVVSHWYKQHINYFKKKKIHLKQFINYDFKHEVKKSFWCMKSMSRTNRITFFVNLDCCAVLSMPAMATHG